MGSILLALSIHAQIAMQGTTSRIMEIKPLSTIALVTATSVAVANIQLLEPLAAPTVKLESTQSSATMTQGQAVDFAL